jgi:hypothetical protein
MTQAPKEIMKLKSHKSRYEQYVVKHRANVQTSAVAPDFADTGAETRATSAERSTPTLPVATNEFLSRLVFDYVDYQMRRQRLDACGVAVGWNGAVIFDFDPARETRVAEMMASYLPIIGLVGFFYDSFCPNIHTITQPFLTFRSDRQAKHYLETVAAVVETGIDLEFDFISPEVIHDPGKTGLIDALLMARTIPMRQIAKPEWN